MLDLLYFLIALVYIILLFFVLKNYKLVANRYFSLFLLGFLLWHVTLYLYLFIPLGDYLLLVGRLNYGAGVLSSLGLLGFFYYFSSTSFDIPDWIKYVIGGFTLFLFGITVFTPLIDKNEVWTANGPVVELGSWYPLYLIHVFGLPILIMAVGFQKNYALSGLFKLKFQYAFWVFVPFMTALLVSTLILPLFGYLEHFMYSPLFALPVVLSSFYAIYQYRFVDIRLRISVMVKRILAFTAAASILYGFYFAAGRVVQFQFFHSNPWHQVFWGILFLIIMVLVYEKTFHFLKSPYFYKIFGYSDAEFFKNTLDEFISAKKFYGTLKELQSQLYNLQKKLHFASLRIEMVRKNGFPELKKVFQVTQDFLVTKEIALKQKEIGITYPFFQELQDLGEVCFPLYGSTKNLIGFLVVGQKHFDEAFTENELEGLVRLSNFINLLLLGIFYNLELRKAVQEKTRELQQKYTLEKEISATLAHELKTPLAIAYNGIQSLMALENKSEKEIPLIQSAHSALKRLDHICNSILALREVDAGETAGVSRLAIEYRIVPLLENFQRLCQEKGLKFNYVIDILPGEFYGGGIQFEQVLSILLENAYNYTEKGSIEVKVESNNKMLTATVRDTGTGIPKDKRKKIFERFYRERNEDNKNLHNIQGLGLGLYIAKKIINQLHGFIHVEDNPSKQGSRFIVQIPIYNTLPAVSSFPALTKVT